MKSRAPGQLDRYVASLLCFDDMKRLTFLIPMLLFFVTPMVAQSDLNYLRNWVGKTPVGIPGEPHRNIYRTRRLQRRLLTLLGWKNYNRLLNDYYVMGPVDLVDNYLTVDRCERHNCDESASFMAVNLRRGDVHVAFYKAGRLEWFHSEGTVRDLPRDVLETEWWRSYGPFIKSITEITKRAT